MIHSIVKYEKKQLAALNTAELAHAVHLHTNRLQANCRAAMREYTEAADGAARAAALLKLEEANIKFDDYLNAQYELFDAKGLPKFRAFKEAIIPTGEVTASGAEVFRIVPREIPITPFDDDGESPSAEDLRQMDDAPEFESDESWEAL